MTRDEIKDDLLWDALLLLGETVHDIRRMGDAVDRGVSSRASCRAFADRVSAARADIGRRAALRAPAVTKMKPTAVADDGDGEVGVDFDYANAICDCGHTLAQHLDGRGYDCKWCHCKGFSLDDRPPEALSPEDQRVLVDALDNPPESNDALRALMAGVPPCPSCVSERGVADPDCRFCRGSGRCPSALCDGGGMGGES